MKSEYRLGTSEAIAFWGERAFREVCGCMEQARGERSVSGAGADGADPAQQLFLEDLNVGVARIDE